jgi:hypothetical protein
MKWVKKCTIGNTSTNKYTNTTDIVLYANEFVESCGVIMGFEDRWSIKPHCAYRLIDGDAWQIDNVSEDEALLQEIKGLSAEDMRILRNCYDVALGGVK